MLFTRKLHEGIRNGEITCTVRIWKSCRVRLGGRYPVAGGHVEVDAIEPIELGEITGELARRSGFKGVIDLLRTARHGSGENVYLISFHYLAPAPRLRSKDKEEEPTQKPRGAPAGRHGPIVAAVVSGRGARRRSCAQLPSRKGAQRRTIS